MSLATTQKSRLQFGQPRILEDIDHWDLLELPVIQPQPDDTFYTILESDRIDRLAFNFYDSAVLWWVIAAANNMELFPVSMLPGLTIRIPSKRYVNQVLFNSSSIKRRGVLTNG